MAQIDAILPVAVHWGIVDIVQGDSEVHLHTVCFATDYSNMIDGKPETKLKLNDFQMTSSISYDHIKVTFHIGSIK